MASEHAGRGPRPSPTGHGTTCLPAVCSRACALKPSIPALVEEHPEPQKPGKRLQTIASLLPQSLPRRSSLTVYAYFAAQSSIFRCNFPTNDASVPISCSNARLLRSVSGSAHSAPSTMLLDRFSHSPNVLSAQKIRAARGQSDARPREARIFSSLNEAEITAGAREPRRRRTSPMRAEVPSAANASRHAPWERSTGTAGGTQCSMKWKTTTRLRFTLTRAS